MNAFGWMAGLIACSIGVFGLLAPETYMRVMPDFRYRLARPRPTWQIRLGASAALITGLVALVALAH